MFGSLPPAARALLWVRALNQVGAFALAFLVVVTGPHLATPALAVFGVAALTSRWAGGVLLDRLTPRIVIAAGLGATGMALAWLAIAHTPRQVLTAVAAVGLAFEIYEPATSELLARVTTGTQRQDAYAVLGAWLVAAGAIAGILAAALLPLGVRWLLVTDATSCIAAAAVAERFLPRDTQEGTGPAQAPRGWRPPAVLMRLTLAATVFAFGYLAVIMFMPFVLLHRGAPAWVPGLTLTAAALLAPATVHLARRPLAACRHTILLATGTTLLGGLALVMAGTSNVPLTALVYIAWAVINSVLLGRWTAIVADAAPDADRPRWFAFQGLSWGIAQPAVPGVVGLLGAIAGGPATAALLAAGVAFLAVPIVLAAARPA
jgi:hypothetical protein